MSNVATRPQNENAQEFGVAAIFGGFAAILGFGMIFMDPPALVRLLVVVIGCQAIVLASMGMVSVLLFDTPQRFKGQWGWYLLFIAVGTGTVAGVVGLWVLLLTLAVLLATPLVIIIKDNPVVGMRMGVSSKVFVAGLVGSGVGSALLLADEGAGLLLALF